MKILLLEDDQNLSYLINENLLAIGYQLDIASTGYEALTKMQNHTYDLYILDLMLPDISGIEVAKKMTRAKINKPFLFLTAIHNLNQRLEAYQIGADDYITKPFSIKELEYKIKIITRRWNKQSPSESYAFGDVTFINDERILKINTQEFKLTKIEFDLMQLFISNINTYVKHEEILATIWGRDDKYTLKSLEVYLNKLRKKIAISKSIKIENLYGLGYRVVET